MVCFYCRGRLIVSSVCFCKKHNYQYSYICFCVNRNCKEYLVKFKKNCKYQLEIHTCKNFQLMKQENERI